MVVESCESSSFRSDLRNRDLEGTMSPRNIFAGLVLLAALFSAYFAAKLHGRRADFMAQIVSLKTERDANIGKLREARNTQAEAEAQLNRQMENWGKQWEAPNSQQFPGVPGLQLGVGKNQGLVTEEKINQPPPALFVFAPGQNGGSRYLGEFQLEQLDANQSGAMLTRAPMPGEVESWPVGTYRVRQFIPAGWRSTFVDLQTQQAIADQNIIDETAKLAIQEKHITESQEALNSRLTELNGDPAAAPKASETVKLGLVESLKRGEVERNEILKVVDSLRRMISDNYARMMQVLAENQQIVESLKSTTAEQTATKAAPSAGQSR
jgi:hypothetical protein